MYPDDKRLEPLLKLCVQYEKPVMFHGGFSWEPDSPSKYGGRFCMRILRWNILRSGSAWPIWDGRGLDEMSMMLLKYPNVYTDTATVFMDSPANYYDQIL